jgi:uncharacterized protein YqgC (DUF456 family)
MLRYRALLLAPLPSIAYASDFDLGAGIYIFLGVACWPFLLTNTALIAIFAKLKKYESRKFAMRHAIVGCVAGAMFGLPAGLLGLNPFALMVTAIFVAVGYAPMYIHKNFY